MVTFPPCKINLGLHVLARRADGYHDISTCFYPVPWTDVLEVLPDKDLNFTQTGIPIPGNIHDNLCLKAYHLLKEDFSLSPVQIHLHKIIPIGAGLGGGSSDAAHTLRSLNTIFQLKLSQEQLIGYALRLGSDCPFFIRDNPMMGAGRGEQLTPIAIDLKGAYLIILAPNVHVSTAEAYAGVAPRFRDESIAYRVAQPVTSWKTALDNDFEPSIFNKYPLIQSMKERLYSSGAIYASMSGSGASVFGIFENETSIKDSFRDVPHWSGGL